MKNLFSCLLLCACITLQAQTGFQKGFIITPAGDTATGFLKSNTYAALAKAVSYQPTVGGSTSTYTCAQLRGFGFEGGDLFTSVTYTDGSDSNRRKREFARVAVSGPYTLYVLPRGDASNYLLQSSDTSYVLYDDQVDLFTKKLVRGSFRNTLAFVTRDCNRASTDFERMTFLEHNIIQTVHKLNSCNGGVSVLHRSKARYDAHFVVYAGASAIDKKWNQLSGGAEVRLRNTKMSRKISFVTGLHYSKTTITDRKWTYYPVGWKYTDDETNIISVPLLVHYTLLDRSFQPYIYAGFGAAYRERTISPRTNSFVDPAKTGVSIIGGVGIEYYPVRFVGIKADWRYELLMQRPSLGLILRL